MVEILCVSLLSATFTTPQIVPEMYTRIVDDETEAIWVANGLIRNSAFFECMPLPDGQWQFSVREDRKNTLDKVCDD